MNKSFLCAVQSHSSATSLYCSVVLKNLQVRAAGGRGGRKGWGDGKENISRGRAEEEEMRQEEGADGKGDR